MAMIPRHKLDRRIRIERPVADPGFDGAGSGAWEPVTTIWAEVQDMLPSRGERIADGVNVAARPARVRIDYRTGINSSMRVLMLRREAGEYVVERTMQIITEPAELGRREALEFVVEEYRPAGNPA